jgi:DNA-binding MarR family transcriptional regulator
MARARSAAQSRSKGGAAFTKLLLETFRLNGRFLVAGDRLTKGIGLTSARWQVLGTLRGSDTPLTVAQIARNMGLQRQSVQRTVDVMSAEGLLRMVDNPRHRRAKLVVLTPKGWTVLRKATRLQIDWANECAAGIDPAELEAAFATLHKLRQRLTG